jgi:predicted ester cyclase
MNASLFKTKAIAAAALVASLASTGAMAQSNLTPEAARNLVEPFYSMLTQPGTKDVRAIAEKFMAPEWKSYSDDSNFKGRDAFINQVMGFGKLIPDLKWDVREVLVSGDRIVVRSSISGTPVGPMFGTPTNGKTFQAMAIDIHTIRDGKSVTVHHVEDWASVLRQLSAK